jgi:WD40 repeat protein
MQKTRAVGTAALCLLLITAACSPAEVSVNGPRANAATLPAPAYVPSAAVITLENVESVRLLGRLDQPETLSTLFAHTISPDGTRLVALNNDEILAWDLLTGALAFRTARLDAVDAFYSPDKTEIFTAAPSGRVVVYDADSGAERASMQVHDDYGNQMAYDAGSGRAAFAGRDGRVRVWDLVERRALAELEAHRGDLSAMAFSDDGALLVTAGLDVMARLWDWQTRTMRAELPLENLLVGAVAFAPSGTQVALGSGSDVRLWSTGDAAQTRRLVAPRGGAAEVLLYSPTGAFLVGGNGTAGLRVWNPVLTTEVGLLPVTGEALSADFSPDGTMLLTSSISDGASVFAMGRAADGEIPRGQLDVQGAGIFASDWTDDGRLLLLFDATGPVYVWGIGEADG